MHQLRKFHDGHATNHRDNQVSPVHQFDQDQELGRFSTVLLYLVLGFQLAGNGTFESDLMDKRSCGMLLHAGK